MKTPTVSPPKTRSVKANGEEIARLRQAKLWRVEDLARKARVSVKTVENVEHGANVYMFTLAKFATAFDVESQSLIAGGTIVQPLPPKKERRIEVNLTISIPYEDFDESEQLVSLIDSLKAVIQAANAITPKAAMAGSTIITLEMSEADVHSLIAAYMAGKLDEMQVQELTIRLTHEVTHSDYMLIDINFATNLPENAQTAQTNAMIKDAVADKTKANEDAKVPERKP
jgi:transcriptional regulator with XRE-family HTH domain